MKILEVLAQIVKHLPLGPIVGGYSWRYPSQAPSSSQETILTTGMAVSPRSSAFDAVCQVFDHPLL